jgi:hypothetical protein
MHHDINDVIDANRRAGQHFFSPDTMRFFQSRLCGNLIGGRFFVTSEKSPQGTRAYSVREARPDAGIDTVGDGFMAYKTADAAKRVAQKLAKS